MTNFVFEKLLMNEQRKSNINHRKHIIKRQISKSPMQIPQKLIDSLQNMDGFEPTTFVKIHETPSPTSIRINPFKKTTQFENHESVIWCESGRYLPTRPAFILDPLFHAGTYYVQEASSMFLEQALKQCLNLDDDLVVLDLCAAPGGKSTHIASLLSADSLLVSNEVIKPRANVLVENLSKWGLPNTVVTNNDPKDFNRIPHFFDALVIDAPCSGSGLFRKDPNAIAEWSEQSVEMCSLRQKRILTDAWTCLKKGGILVYSTCSYSQSENEDILDWITEEFDVKSLKINAQEGIVHTLSAKHQAHGYRFYPDKIKGEGFFLAVFEKGEDNVRNITTLKYTKPRPNKKLKLETQVFSTWIEGLEDYVWLEKNEEYFLINPEQEHNIKLLQANLYLRKAGVRLGKIAGKDLIPDHELALSTVLSEAVERVELTKEQALKYLRRDEIQVESQYRGWALMTYQNQPLGWAKILPNRINNYFPKELRILKELSLGDY
jgi:NOL1/NOP2/sun family putative RNA methylase